MTIEDRFYLYFSHVQDCYVKFHLWQVENPGSTEHREAAYRAKDQRTKALCELMSALAEMGFSDFGEAHRKFFQSEVQSNH